MKYSTKKKAQKTSTSTIQLAISPKRRLLSLKSILIICRITYVYQTKSSRAESDSKSKSQARLIEKGYEKLSIYNPQVLQ